MTQTFLIKNGEIVLDQVNGQILMVSDKLKLGQDLQECLSIEVQTNGFGAGLTAIIGRLGDEFTVRAEVGRLVRQAIDRMKALQTKLHRRERPTSERIFRLNSLTVTPFRDGKTTFLFKTDVLTEVGTLISTSSRIG